MIRTFFYFSFLLLALLLCQQHAFANAFNTAHDKIVLVEYYDYECPHCRNMEPIIEALKIKYPNLRIIYKPTPLLTPQSASIAALVLASEKENHTLRLHKALMNLNHTPSFNEALLISAQLGLNNQMLLNRVSQSDIQQQLKQNIMLAETYAVAGGIYLPIFTVGKINQKSPDFTLTGEQPFALLSALIKQENENVQMDKQEKQHTS